MGRSADVCKKMPKYTHGRSLHIHTDKAIVQDTTIKIAVNNLSQIRPEKAILPFKALLIDLLECLKMVFNTAIIR